MALVLNDEHRMLRDSARSFFDARAPVAHLRALRDDASETGFCGDLWSEMADMGWAGTAIPETWGGLGYGFTGLGLLLQESGRTLTPSPLLSTALLGAGALVLSGNEALCAEWLPQVADGRKLLALAFEESARHRPMPRSTRARASGNGFLINGRKTAVIDGHVADAFIVSALAGDADSSETGMSLFLVSADSPGVRVETSHLLDNHRVASVDLDDVGLGPEQLLGQFGQGYPLLEDILDRGRIGMAAEMLGIADETFARTVQYLKERKQFGVPIGSFQSLQHRAAVLFGEIELCRSVVLKAMRAVDEGSDEVAVLASLAKAKCGRAAATATAEGIQMHGGIGMTDELDIGLFIKRWRALNQHLGDSRYHLERFAQLQGY